MSSVLQYAITFQDEYVVCFLQAHNVDIAEEMLASNFLDWKTLNTVLRYGLVGKLFYEQRVLFNLVKYVMLVYRTAKTVVIEVGSGLAG